MYTHDINRYMKKSRTRLKRVRRRELRRKIVFIIFLLLLILYVISKIETLSPVRAISAPTHDVVYIEKEVEVIKEVEVDRRFDSEKQQILAYIVEVFGDDSADAINILYCENRNLDPKAVNHNRNGTSDLGIFQLNDAYWGGEENFDWKTNVDKAYKIFKSSGWKAWSCSTRIGVKSFWQ